MLISPFFLLLPTFLKFTLSLSCCNNNSICHSNASCLCQPPIDSCLYEIIESSLPYPLSQPINYFNWVPSTSQYISVTINICSKERTSIKAGFKIQNENATGHPTEANIFFTVGEGECYEIYIASPKFCETPSGGYCNLILALGAVGGDGEVMDIYVGYVEGLTKYIVFILIAIGSVLLLVVVILVACMIRKKMIGNPIVQTNSLNTIQHLDLYTTKGKFADLKNLLIKTETPETCSVCLSQIQRDDIVRITPCCHIFHTDCVDLWCVRNLSCPICRQPLDEQNLGQKKRQVEPEVSAVQLGRVVQEQNLTQEGMVETENALVRRSFAGPDNNVNKLNEQNIIVQVNRYNQ